MTQRIPIWQRALKIVLSLCSALALTMRFAVPELSAEQQVSIMSTVLWDIRGSLSDTGITVTLLFVGFIALSLLVDRMRTACPRRALLFVSFLIALIWLMGTAFRIDNSLAAIIANSGQVVKSICYVLGSAWFLYLLSQLLFFFLEKQTPDGLKVRSQLGQMYQRHPFGVSFSAILLFWLPHLVIAYPGYMCYDAWHQLAQYFGILEFTAHHPPVHTLLLGTLVRVGINLGSGNLGLYLFVITQVLIEAGIFAYIFVLIKDWGTPRWLRIGSFCVIVLCPYYTAYVPLVLKDNLYAAFFTLFVAECICVMKDGVAYLEKWRHRLLLVLSIMGTILFRNNGKYVLYPTLLALLIYFWILLWKKGVKKGFCKLAIWLLLPVLLSSVLTSMVTVHYNIQKGSIAEALSLPFQQTARYVSERPEEVTSEERQAIQAVLDYDHLAEKYDPRISDPVKALYHKEATREDLLHYFNVWFKMFLKHPDIYIKATVNQNYYLIYPFAKNEVIYSSTFPNGWFIKPTNEILQIVEPDSLTGWKTTAQGLYRTLFSLPVIGLLSQQATYGLLLIALFIFAVVKKRWCWLIVFIPSVMSVIVIILAPVIQGHPRYAFPYIYAMPLMLAYYMYLGQAQKERTKI